MITRRILAVILAGAAMALVLCPAGANPTPIFAEPPPGAPVTPPPKMGENDKKMLPREVQNKVDKAIANGMDYLSSYISNERLPTMESTDGEGFKRTMRYADLILYTLAHSGISKNEDWKPFIKRVTELPLDRTYHVALQAMALEYIDRVKYQKRIAECGQFLIDNQCQNGQWSYGTEPESIKKTGTNKILPTGGSQDAPNANQQSQEPRSSGATKSIPLIKLSGGPKGPPKGDNSNTQYAILGIRACIEANIGPFDNSLQMSKKWMLLAQDKDGSWGYSGQGFIPSPGYGSMTMGITGSLCIVKYYLKELPDVNKEPWFNKAMRWITKNYTVKENPCAGEIGRAWNYYYLYAMERMGVLADQPKLGGNDWYQDGAKFLVEKQSDSGDWNGNIYDTCFALLFLTRATTPLISTGTNR